MQEPAPTGTAPKEVTPEVATTGEVNEYARRLTETVLQEEVVADALKDELGKYINLVSTFIKRASPPKNIEPRKIGTTQLPPWEGGGTVDITAYAAIYEDTWECSVPDGTKTPRRVVIIEGFQDIGSRTDYDSRSRTLQSWAPDGSHLSVFIRSDFARPVDRVSINLVDKETNSDQVLGLNERGSLHYSCPGLKEGVAQPPDILERLKSERVLLENATLKPREAQPSPPAETPPAPSPAP